MIAPPLLVSYISTDYYLRALNEDTRAQYEENIRALAEKNLPPVVSYRCLGLLFGLSARFVHSLMNEQKYYRTFKIKKSNNQKRTIHAPRVALKLIQTWFGHHLALALKEDPTFPDNHIFGFVPGKSHILAAQEHCASKPDWVYSVDIENFFGTTDKDTLKKQLEELGYSEHACDIILTLCCYQDHLPQGAPSSPVLSNLAMKETDKKLCALAEQKKILFTRYADDIVFSGSGKLNSSNPKESQKEFRQELRNSLDEIFRDTCWKISESKTYYAESAQGMGLKVHGLLIHNNHVRLPKSYRNKIRAYQHMLNPEKATVKERDIKRLTGHVKYAQSVENIGTRNNAGHTGQG